jgi:uncharacterized membrane-anchored protein YitT (DUF2179 family)
MITDNQNCKTTVSHLHWTAIFAGAFVGVGLGFLLNMFGIAIGLSAYSMGPNGAAAIAIGGILGLLIGVIVSMGAAGFVSGYLSRFYHCHCHTGIIYGFITWSMALILSALLLMPLTHYASVSEKNLAPVLNKTEVYSGDADNSENKQKLTPPKPEDVNVKHLAASSWILFILFFIGALSSCIGSCCGMGCKKEDVNPHIQP